MRDGMPVVALVISIIALVVALTGLVAGGPSATEDAPEAAIQRAEDRLKKLGVVMPLDGGLPIFVKRVDRHVFASVVGGPEGVGVSKSLDSVDRDHHFGPFSRSVRPQKRKGGKRDDDRDRDQELDQGEAGPMVSGLSMGFNRHVA